LKNFDSSKENLWILEINQQPKGSIGIVKVDETSAQLRWFLIEPDVRGRGFGNRLVQTAIDFCRDKKYKTIFLWTNSELIAARRIYKKYGFKITETKRKKLSNQDLIEERWELSL
jgi:GNAT superfamily N-acetyltransferase